MSWKPLTPETSWRRVPTMSGSKLLTQSTVYNAYFTTCKWSRVLTITKAFMKHDISSHAFLNLWRQLRWKSCTELVNTDILLFIHTSMFHWTLSQDVAHTLFVSKVSFGCLYCNFTCLIDRCSHQTVADNWKKRKTDLIQTNFCHFCHSLIYHCGHSLVCQCCHSFVCHFCHSVVCNCCHFLVCLCCHSVAVIDVILLSVLVVILLSVIAVMFSCVITVIVLSLITVILLPVFAVDI